MGFRAFLVMDNTIARQAMAENGWKWQKMAENGWKWPKKVHRGYLVENGVFAWCTPFSYFFLGSFLIHPFLGYVSIYGMIVCECVSERGLNGSHPSSVLRRLSHRTGRRTCCNVVNHSFPLCSWIKATGHDASYRILSIPLIFEKSYVPCLLCTFRYFCSPLGSSTRLPGVDDSVSLFPSLPSYSHPRPCSSHMLVNQELIGPWTSRRSYITWLPFVSRFNCQTWSFV